MMQHQHATNPLGALGLWQKQLELKRRQLKPKLKWFTRKQKQLKLWSKLHVRKQRALVLERKQLKHLQIGRELKQ
ncbi:hypothetical protein PHMEG_00010633 [Phytophthora megakarya]|uniref:Uncharacterized protein n=1 Tax=Phytophthora megakarya TaxID=4795 RepID=A0A225WF82_9STRA|nr:hypothetical protein PHMEG_00010633 [Phytophthora megakarya]